jgi:CheY-like chemotaxis protein
MSAGTVMLVAEDVAAFCFLIERALAKAKIEVTVKYVSDGQEVIDYLRGAGKYADRTAFPLPHLVVLDLKMPRMGGLEALAWVRQQHTFNNLHVMVLTSSDEEPDLRRAKELHADAYVVKPSSANDLAHALREFFDAWTTSGGHHRTAGDRPRAPL